MNFLLDISQQPVNWSVVCFFLSGLLLLSGSLLQKRRGNRDLAGYQLNTVFQSMKTQPVRVPLQMCSVLPLPLMHGNWDEMQVVEDEF